MRRHTRSSLRVLVIDGHPRRDSLGDSLAATMHRAAATRSDECRLIRLRELDFDPREHGSWNDCGDYPPLPPARGLPPVS